MFDEEFGAYRGCICCFVFFLENYEIEEVAFLLLFLFLKQKFNQVKSSKIWVELFFHITEAYITLYLEI